MYIQKNDAESLLGLIDDALRKEDVNWNNCVAIGMDNTSVSSIVIEVTETALFVFKKRFLHKNKTHKYLNTPKKHNKAHSLAKIVLIR